MEDQKLGSKPGSIVSTSGASSNDASVGMQIALESEHQIKYRTCSWQKVRPDRIRTQSSVELRLFSPFIVTFVSFRFVGVYFLLFTWYGVDGRAAVLRVYMPRHYVLPLVRPFLLPQTPFLK